MVLCNLVNAYIDEFASVIEIGAYRNDYHIFTYDKTS